MIGKALEILEQNVLMVGHGRFACVACAIVARLYSNQEPEQMAMTEYGDLLWPCGVPAGIKGFIREAFKESRRQVSS